MFDFSASTFSNNEQFPSLTRGREKTEEKPGAGKARLGSKAPARAGLAGAEESASHGACFDKSVVPLVAWGFSKLQGNLADTLQTPCSGCEHVCVCTRGAAICCQPGSSVLPLRLCLLGLGWILSSEFLACFPGPYFSCFSH